MSSGGKCSCGSSCKCGDNCACEIENTVTAILIAGVAPPVQMYSEGSEKSSGAEGGNGCKCGSNCTCDPCNC